MAAVTKLQVYPEIRLPVRSEFSRKCMNPNSIQLLGRCGRNCRGLYRQICRSFKEGNDFEEKEKGAVDFEGNGPGELKEGSGSAILSSLKSAILSISKWPSCSAEEYRNKSAELEEVFFSIALQIGRYIVTMMSTGVILLTGFQMSGGDTQMNHLIWYSWLGGIIIGTMVGANMVLDEHSRAGPRNVVITGSTRGLGKALAREFLLSGDRVVVASRRLCSQEHIWSPTSSCISRFFLMDIFLFLKMRCPEGSADSVDATVKELQENLKEMMAVDRKTLEHAKVVGIACDVCDPNDVRNLAKFSASELGSIDIWINNAGMNKGFRPLLQFSDEDVLQIVSTNLIGSILCTREAMLVLGGQDKGGHIFNMDGAGSGGSSTPLTAVYGSTKCGLRQLQASLLKESRRTNIGVHTASPGMVLTDLLLSGSTLENKQMFNIICELPETVARTLVPRMRVVKGSGKAINYLTPPRILLALVTAWLRRGRWFDDKGRALYAAEADRIRNWAADRTQFSFTDAMEMYTENTWISVFSLSVVCAFIILSSTTGSSFPGT